MNRNIRDLHKIGMSKLRKLLDTNIRVIYSDNSSVIVPCTISDETMELLKYNEYIGEVTKVFNILVEDLLKNKGKVTDFKYVEYNRVRYQVLTKLTNGNYNNTIKLLTKIFKGGLNE